MKKGLRILAILSILAIVLCGCKGKGYAIKIDDRVVSEEAYARQAATAKEYLATLGESAPDQESFEEIVSDYLITLKLYALQFDALGLSFSAEEEEEMDEYLSSIVSSYESMTAFQAALTEAGYTYEEYLEEIYDNKKKSKVLQYYFGPEGKEPVAVQDLKDYYALHNAVIKFVATSTVDADGQPLSAEMQKEAKEKAEDAFAEATRKTQGDHFSEVIELFSEDTSTRDTPMVISDENMGTDTLTSKVMKMEVGQVILAEVDGGYMVIKRYSATSEEHFTPAVQQSVLEEYRAEEIDALIEKWRGEATIKINKKITKKYQ